MIHFSSFISSAGDASAFLRRQTVQDALSSARSILIQLFVSTADSTWIGAAIETIVSIAPEAVVIGTVSEGEISEGKIGKDSAVLSLAAFQGADLHPFVRQCGPGEEYQTGASIAESLAEMPNLRGLLLLAPPATLNCALLLEGIDDRRPDLAVFGGGAAGGRNFDGPSVFGGTEALDTGVVGVAFSGESLHIECRTSLGWRPIGPRLKLTEANASVVHAINGKPAAESYRRYLGVDTDSDLFLLEFPLIFERDGTVVARNPMSFGADGRVTFAADVCQGEAARFGYPDLSAMMQDINTTALGLQRFGAEAIFLYSCVCRRFVLHQDAQVETLSLQRVAPAAGFFGYGEFGRPGRRLQLLNSTLLAVAMREGPPRLTPAWNQDDQDYLMDRHRIRNARITSRLLDVVTALTAELEESNRRFRFQAEHDPLTGALNRQGFSERLTAEVRRAARYRRPLSIAMFDLDQFKRFNDTHGHEAGDHVLKSAAALISATTRHTDLLCRYGGEEFVLILPETGLSEALIAAEGARAAIESLELDHEGTRLPAITASFGVASYPDHVGDSGIAPLIKAADVAMYRSKAKGRNCVSHAGEAG